MSAATHGTGKTQDNLKQKNTPWTVRGEHFLGDQGWRGRQPASGRSPSGDPCRAEGRVDGKREMREGERDHRERERERGCVSEVATQHDKKMLP